MPTLFKDCVICGVPREVETEYYSDGNKRQDGATRKRADCVYCCRERRKKYFQSPAKREQINIRRRKDYANDSSYRYEYNRRAALKSLYGLTLERYNEMRKEQNYCCAVCNIHESEAVRKKLYVDHSHKNNTIRGLLCATCNSALGLFREDTETLNRAIVFLQSKK